jgi:hypothetical protein
MMEAVTAILGLFCAAIFVLTRSTLISCPNEALNERFYRKEMAKITA